MITCLLLAFASPAAPAQEPSEIVYSRDELSLTTYTPRWIEADALHSVASELFGRDIRLEDRFVANLNLLYDSILIYDTPEECSRIVGTLTQLEKRYQDANSESPTDSGLPLLRDVPLLDFRLRAMDGDAAMAALEPHFRDVRARNEDGVYLSFANVQRLDEGLLLMRDTAENLVAMSSLLERLDQPPPQVRLSAMVLLGVEAAEPQSLPKELAADLASLLPGMQVVVNGRGLLTASATPRRRVQLGMSGIDGSRYQLELITGPYDAETGRMTLDSCRFLADPGTGEMEQLFDTSAVLAGGEYTVIGLTGAEPVLLVLRLTPMD